MELEGLLENLLLGASSTSQEEALFWKYLTTPGVRDV